MTSALIVGGDSDHNLGDAAILAALCHCLARSRLRPAITITSAITSAMSGQRRGAGNGKALPGVERTISRSWRDVLSSAREQDLVVVGGGGLFQDDDSRVKMPYWAARLAALRLVNRNLVGHCVGAGPLRHPESRGFARLVCRALRSITVRDRFARDSLAGCNDTPIEIVPDPAFMLPPAPADQGAAFIRACNLDPRRPLIGVALRRWFHPLGGFIPHRWRARSPGNARRGRAELAMLLEEVAIALRRLAHRLDAAVLLMPTYNVAHEGDAEVCRQLIARLPDVRVELARIVDPSLYKSVAGHLSLMLSARMHPLILAAGMGVPIVGLAYNGKFAALFELLRLPPRLIALDDFAAGPQACRLELHALSALVDGPDLAQRSAELAAQVESRTLSLFESGGAS